MRVIQPKGTKGSLRWIQQAGGSHPIDLQPHGLPKIEWVSPLAEDDFAEYRDAAFLDRLGIGCLSESLREFWPQRGPQWDALGFTSSGPVLVEAKAHISEFFSPPSQAGPSSLVQIRQALSRVQSDLGCKNSSDWVETYYQYANRLAFLWWLRKNGVDANIIFVSFLSDPDMSGPKQAETWEAAFASADYSLGLPKKHSLTKHIFHVFPDVLKMGKSA
jgi:hypothetical protein